MNTYAFWLDHADAAGAALIVSVLALAALAAVVRRYERLARGQRATYRAQRLADRKEFRRRYQALLDARPGGFDDHATRSLGIARTRLTESYLDRTVADVPRPYTPVFTRGGRD